MPTCVININSPKTQITTDTEIEEWILGTLDSRLPFSLALGEISA